MYDSRREFLKNVLKDLLFNLDIPDSELQSAISNATADILHLPKDDVHFRMVYKLQHECRWGRVGEMS